MPLDERFHVRRSLQKTMRKCSYEVKFNTDFAAVIRACARAWITSSVGAWNRASASRKNWIAFS